jgi:predicted ribosome quality control (RQC) complex YloA/Tae2 family protein
MKRNMMIDASTTTTTTTTSTNQRKSYFITTIMTMAMFMSSIRNVASFNNVLSTGRRPSFLISALSKTKGKGTGTISFMKSTKSTYMLPTNRFISISSQSSNNSKGILTMEAAADSETENMTEEENIEKTTWNIPGLKKETSRLNLRCIKKIGKASTRLTKANEQVEEIRTNPDATQEQLEACPNVKVFEDELDQLKERLKGLNLLEEKLQAIKGGKSVELPQDVLSMVRELDVNDEPPKREVRPKKKKKKGPRTEAKRMPYFRYYTQDNTEIRVGRRADENDELSCNPAHRDGADWWMHASGCPGSHVVIRCHDNSLEKDVIMDAAALAARQSKCNGNVIKVNLTRCRDVKKPPGAKFGLVTLVGKVETVCLFINILVLYK